MIVNNTPVETYMVGAHKVYVKREDLCCTDGPPFSKMRGVFEHLKALKQQGITTVGYVETSISMAGWGVAWTCAQLGMTAVIYDPQYITANETLIKHRAQWQAYKAEIRYIKAGMAKVNFNICRRVFEAEFPSHAVMLPLGLPFDETIKATAAEVARTLRNLPVISTFVTCVGSGTICAGLWSGVAKWGQPAVVYGIMCRSGNLKHKRSVIEQKAHLRSTGLYKSEVGLFIKNPGWEYTDYSTAACPFPCNQYYDRKGWQWLIENIDNLKTPILFWNIGS